MKIATVLFTYNRAGHTEAVLQALKKNYILPEKLYIFQDGKKESTNEDEWKRVGDVITNVKWCDTEVHINAQNKGLANSIADGVNYVLEQNDAVIVLEDDCVPHPMFMSYMVEALYHYQKNEKVYSIGAWAWPVEVSPNGTDVYATQRICSTGWATWKNCWEYFERDYFMLKRIKQNDVLNQKFHIWGEDLESYLLGNISGKCDSWAVFWALKVLERDGYCIAPYKSLIDNIGFDGTGTHSGNRKIETTLQQEMEQRNYVFDDALMITEETKDNFSDYFAWTAPEEKYACYNEQLSLWLRAYADGKTLLGYFKQKNINQISIWGKGKICDLVLEEVGQEVQVLSIIESKPTAASYKEIPIVDAEHIPEEAQLIVVIPEFDSVRIKRKAGKYCKVPVLCLGEILALL